MTIGKSTIIALTLMAAGSTSALACSGQVNASKYTPAPASTEATLQSTPATTTVASTSLSTPATVTAE